MSHTYSHAMISAISLASAVLLLFSVVPTTDANPAPQFFGGNSDQFFEFDTTLSPATTSAPTTTEPTTQETTTDRNSNPFYNVWAFAYTHDRPAPPVNTRTADEELPQAAPVEVERNGDECLWAIISCCDATSNYDRDNCFDALNCPGAWFQNLCSQEYIDIANTKINSLFSG